MASGVLFVRPVGALGHEDHRTPPLQSLKNYLVGLAEVDLNLCLS
jgi:hypothetical protein